MLFAESGRHYSSSEDGSPYSRESAQHQPPPPRTLQDHQPARAQPDVRADADSQQ